jgi:hypothetical protein
MKTCPTCGHCSDSAEPKSAALEVEVTEESEDVGDEEVSAKDEILAELMEQLGGVLEGKLKSKQSPVA